MKKKIIWTVVIAVVVIILWFVGTTFLQLLQMK